MLPPIPLSPRRPASSTNCEELEPPAGADYARRAGAQPMSQTLINTLRFADRLKEAGFAGPQAEALARVLGDELTEQLPSKADFQTLQADFKALEAKFDALEAKFDGLEAKFDGLEAKFNDLEGKFDTLERRFDALEGKFDTLERRFDALEGKFDTLERRFDALEGKFDTLERRFDALEGKFGVLEAKFDGLRYTLNLVLVLVGLLVALGLIEPLSKLFGS